MKFTKSQYEKLEELIPIARKPAKISNYKFMCAMLYIVENGCKWRALPKKYGNCHTIYMKFSRWSQNGTIAKRSCFFPLKPLEVIKKQKLLNEEDYIFFIDSTSIKVSPDANKNKKNQRQSIGRSKGGLTIKLHLCCTFSWPVVFRLSPGNSHDTPEGRKLIDSIYPKNNNYLLMDRVYEDDKTLALTKITGLRPLFHLKKNRKLLWIYDRHLYKYRNNIERYFVRLKRFRKVFTRYDKLDSIFISTISLVFIFDLLFMRTLPSWKFDERL